MLRILSLTLGVGLLIAGLAGCSPGGSEQPRLQPSSAAAPASSTISATQAYQMAATLAKGLSVGPADATNVVYVFFDPQCPHCAALWQSAKPILGSVRMVWIPVAFLDAKSAPQGAELLAATDHAAAMDAHEALIAAGNSGTAPSTVPSNLLHAVAANTRLWIELGGDAVPFIVYRNARTGQPATYTGELPTDALRQALGLA